MAKDLFEVGGGMDEITMRTVESLCLPEKKFFLPEEISRIRTKNHLSQPVFALMLGIGKTTHAAIEGESCASIQMIMLL